MLDKIVSFVPNLTTCSPDTFHWSRWIALGAALGTVCAVSGSSAEAADREYRSYLVSALVFEKEKPVLGFPELTTRYDLRSADTTAILRPYAVLDSGAEAYVGCPGASEPLIPFGQLCENLTVSSATGRSDTFAGTLVLPDFKAGVMRKYRFTSPTDSPVGSNESATFLTLKRQHFTYYVQTGRAGGAWFREQQKNGIAQQHSSTVDLPVPGGRRESIDDTFHFLSGGRAISENIQLDRTLILSESNDETIPVSTISGINVAEIDWSSRIKGRSPDLDSLATIVPSDQFAFFFREARHLISTLNEIEHRGSFVLPLLEERSEDDFVLERYQNQLSLPFERLSAEPLASLVDGVAITGSDPYVRTGTDVAVLIESRDPKQLAVQLEALREELSARGSGARRESGALHGVTFSGVATSDRRVSSFLAILPNAVVLSNSKTQLEKILATSAGVTTSLSKAGEYVFFRDRYKRSNSKEGLFLIVPDRAIRNWGSPKWRIAASRRIRATSMLMALHVRHAKEILTYAKDEQPRRIEGPAALGELTLGSSGVVSSRYGSIEFMTPISELIVDRVSQVEAKAYERFRDTYSSYWRTYFDPIGASLELNGNSISGDLTVMPLIAGSEYNSLKSLANGASLTASSGDRHEDALVNVIVALDSSGKTMNLANNWGAMFIPTVSNPLGWIGNSASLYLDDGTFWDELVKAGDSERFLSQHYQELPLGIFVEVKDSLKMTIFLGAVRGFVEQSSPGMTVWKTLERNGTPYVEIREAKPSAVSVGGESRPWTLYYAATPTAFIASLRQDVLIRALDRLQSPQSDHLVKSGDFLEGSSFAVETNDRIAPIAHAMLGEEFLAELRRRCWGNIPILDELRKSFPDRDPLVVFRTLWRSELSCPAGGTYAWNDTWKSMASTAIGHPGAPIKLTSVGPLKGIKSARWGLGFVEDGIRAKAILNFD